MKISKKDALMWFEFFAQLPEGEQLSVRQQEIVYAVLAQIEDAVDARREKLMAEILEGLDRLGKETNVLTNADRIRAMTDEELCEFLSKCEFCDICPEGCDNCTYHGDCDKRLLDWLQQPAEGDA